VAWLPLAWLRLGPLPAGLLDLSRHASAEIVDRDGEPLYEVRSPAGGRQKTMGAQELPENLVRATLAAEDERFFTHAGVDPLALLRAAMHNLRAGRLREGGSTITQQVAKLLIDRPRTLRGKARELVVALRLEHRLEKKEILALYLTLAPYGNQLVGARAASLAYFGCPPENLTLAQAALLAALPQRPSALNPHRNLEGALARQRWVLARLGELDLAGDAELAQARAERIQVLRGRGELLAPHFVERVREGLPAGTRRVETTLDRALQEKLRGILLAHRERLEQHGAANVAVAVLDNARGEWLAWEGSGGYLDTDHGGAIDGVVTPRQPGSALKPFTYALAFERGFTPASVLPDVPSYFPTAEEGVLYSPRNYDGRFRGPMRARMALGGSENVPAVWLLAQTGVPDLLRLLRRAGLGTLTRTADHYGFALTMGDAEVRLDELVAAYAALARGGVWQAPRMVRRVTAADGSVTEPAAGVPQRIVSERAAFWVADVLADPRARAWAFGRGSSLDFPFAAAVKTGTSQAYRDNWTIGFTRDLTVGVWVGNFDRRELRNSSGVTGAAPIFHDVLLAAQAHVAGRLPAPGEAVVAPVAGLAPVTICALSGHRASRACPAVELEWLPAPASHAACTWHVGAAERASVRYPARYRGWAREAGLPEWGGVPSGGAADVARVSYAVREREREGLRILSPPSGAVYLRDPTLRDEYQTLPLRAAGAGGVLRWEVNGEKVGETRSGGALDWPLRAGKHTITVRASSGDEESSSIVVK
jgi:penicillin-binding protein 1C